MKKTMFLIVILLISIVYTSTVYADSLDYETINSEQKYGYWMDVNGQQGFVVCDPETGEPIRDAGNMGEVWVNNPKQVQVKGKQVHLYAADVWNPPLWRGTDALMPLSAYGTLPENMEFVTPYGSELPDAWRWVIFEYRNNNDWPITARVEHGLRNCGETYSGEKYFGPRETKYLRLKLNADAPLSTLPVTITHSHVVNNYDIDAPTEPVDYTYNPPAFDGTGITWTTSYYRGISIVTEPKEGYNYRSKGLWTLVPGFKEVPVWTPESEDGYWGNLSFKTVPAWLWVSYRGLEGKRGDTVSLKDTPNAPYIVGGKTGAYTKEPDASPHCGPYIKYTYTPFVKSKKKGTVENNWWEYVEQEWPDRVEIEVNYNKTKGCFYTDQSKSRIIDWKGSSIITWAESVRQNQQSDYVPESSPNPLNIPNRTWDNTPVDGKDYFYSFDDSVAHVILNKDGTYYAPVTGSYVQIDNIKYNNKGGALQTDCTYYLYVYNPGDSPVVYTLRDALWWQSDESRFILPPPDQGTVTIPPHQGIVLTGKYSTPQGTVRTDRYGYQHFSGYSKAVPPEWCLSWRGDASPLFKVGAVAPIEQNDYLWAYRIDNIKNNVVAYDGGLFYGRHNELFRISKSKASPLIDGSKLVDEKAMTPEELMIYLRHCDADVRNKANEILSYGTATWSINQDYHMKAGDDGGTWVTSKLIP